MNTQENERIAAQAMDAGNFEEAVRILELLAEQNSHYALLSLGWIFDSGKSGKRNAELAAIYYGRAAALGDGAGFFELGRLFYDEGKLVEARHAFEEGRGIGNIQCSSWYGLMMAKGEGGEKNIQEAMAILRLASNEGQLVARRALYEIELNSTKSILRKSVIYCKICWAALSAVIEALKDPYSVRGYR